MAEPQVIAEHTEFAKGWDIRTIQEAYDEVSRECQVRARCFPRWVNEGRMSTSDAKDRLQRLLQAKFTLEKLLGLDQAQETPRPF